MKAGIETLEDVDREYGPVLGKAVADIYGAAEDDTGLPLGAVVDALVEVVEVTMKLVAADFGFDLNVERKEGF